MTLYSSSLLVLLVARAAADPNSIAADSSHVKWVGRVQPTGDGGVGFDWEGVSASVTLANFTYLLVQIADDCGGTAVGGGSRWGVAMNTSDAKVAAANHRIQTFYSGPLARSYYLFSNPGGKCDPHCDARGPSTFSLTRLTESRLSGCTPERNLTVVSFSSDGSFLAAPAPKGRRLEFVGDSITAGDLNDGGQLRGGAPDTTCANSAFNDDITFSSGAVLCSDALGFGADCMYTAWGGIQLGVGAVWGMSDLYPRTFSSLGPSAYGDWDFGRFAADAVVLNLGTNGGWRANQTAWVAEYVRFGTDVALTHYRNPDLVLFLAYGPMTTAYQAMAEQVVASLKAAGVKAVALDLTVGPMHGCYGPPSRADNIAIAAKAKAQIADALGWSWT